MESRQKTAVTWEGQISHRVKWLLMWKCASEQWIWLLWVHNQHRTEKWTLDYRGISVDSTMGMRHLWTVPKKSSGKVQVCLWMKEFSRENKEIERNCSSVMANGCWSARDSWFALKVKRLVCVEELEAGRIGRKSQGWSLVHPRY